MIKRTVTTVITAAMLLAGVAGLASMAGAQDEPSTGDPAASTSATEGGGRQRPGLLRRAVHGDLLVKGEGDQLESVTFDRGKLVAKGEGAERGKVVIERVDGTRVTATVVESTRFRQGQSLDSLVVGKPALVVHAEGVAKAVAQPDPERRAARQARRAAREGDESGTAVQSGR